MVRKIPALIAVALMLVGTADAFGQPTFGGSVFSPGPASPGGFPGAGTSIGPGSMTGLAGGLETSSSGLPSGRNPFASELLRLFESSGGYDRGANKNPYGEGNPFPPGTPPNPYGFFGIVSGYQ